MIPNIYTNRSFYRSYTDQFQESIIMSSRYLFHYTSSRFQRFKYSYTHVPYLHGSYEFSYSIIRL